MILVAGQRAAQRRSLEFAPDYMITGVDWLVLCIWREDTVSGGLRAREEHVCSVPRDPEQRAALVASLTAALALD